jgi:hypothetical protein
MKIIDDLAFLKGTREVIANPHSWVQGKIAVSKLNLQCNPTGLDACAWCLVGAAYIQLDN